MFYSRRPQTMQPPKRKALRLPEKAHSDNYGQLSDGLKSLGLVVSPAQVAVAVKEIYPDGVGETSQGELLRTVFLHLKRQYSADSVR
jgi:hypothetical protein